MPERKTKKQGAPRFEVVKSGNRYDIVGIWSQDIVGSISGIPNEELAVEIVEAVQKVFERWVS